MRVYPARDQDLGWAVPDPIRGAFGEALACFSAKAFTATALMCRKAVEGMCEDQAAGGGSLAARLKRLRDSGAIENRLYEWADQLRISGNEAAHDVGVRIERRDAADMLEFTRAVMEYVYTFSSRFEHFKKRRAT